MQMFRREGLAGRPGQLRRTETGRDEFPLVRMFTAHHRKFTDNT